MRNFIKIKQNKTHLFNEGINESGNSSIQDSKPFRDNKSVANI